MRLREVAAVLLQLQLLRAARLDSGDFNKVLGQITKGNRMEQCPCVRPPEGGACISYDSRFQASHVEEAMISFVDLTLPDRERPTDADSLACVSAECRACFSMLFYRLMEIGLIPQGYRPSIPVVPQASLNPSHCPRLRFPSATDFSDSATSALAAVPPSAAIAGLIERGNRFARAAEAAAAASEAISKLKDQEAKNSNHHGQRGRKKQNRNQNNNNNRNNNNNNRNNNNNNNQVQVTPAQNMGQGRSGSSTPQPSRQFTVQQQLRVQQPSWQQQQQMAQQAQQARWQQQQLQVQQQQQFQTQQQQQFPQQQQWHPQQQQWNPQQQFPQQQFNPQQVLQTARQLNTIADTITGIHEGIHAARLLHRWPSGRPPHPGPGPGPHPGWPGPGPGPNPGWPGSGPGSNPGPSPGHGGGSSESQEDDGYHDHHHHHHHHQGPLQQFQRPQDMIPQPPQGTGLPQPPPPFFGNNAGVQAGAGPTAGVPPPFPGGGIPGGGFPGGGGSAGGGVGGGWGGGGGGRWPFRRIRSSPLERRRRAILASQTGAKHPVEMEVVSPLISPLIPKELRPEPVEVSFNHDAEHIFSEERSAFAELVRDKRQNVQEKDDGVLGSRFTIACFDRGETENGADDKMLSLCGGCWVWRRLPEGFFPPIVNELVCKKEDRCLSGWGRCVDKTRSVNVLRKVKGQWTAAALSTGTCCDCKIVAGSEIHALIVG